MNSLNFASAGSNQLPRERRNMKAAISFVDRALTAAGSKISAFGTNLKVGRMVSVLSKLSDQQLAGIGIKRSEIRHHAEYLIGYEYVGL